MRVRFVAPGWMEQREIIQPCSCALSAMRVCLFRAPSFVIFVYDRAEMKVAWKYVAHTPSLLA